MSMRGGENGAPSSSSAAAIRASLSFSVRARSVLSLRRSNQVVSMENVQEQQLRELDDFHARVADCLRSLVSVDDDMGKEDGPPLPTQEHRHPLISLSFLQKLLDAFVCIEEEFKALLVVLLRRDPALLSCPAVDRLVADLLDRAVKSLDVCNAVTQALDSLYLCQKHAEIAASALHPPASGSAAAPVGEAQFIRARRALSKLLAFLTPENCVSHSGATTERASSFERRSRGGGASAAAAGYGRRCPWLDVSRNWSAAKQMQAMCLSPPRGAEATPVAMAVYTMSAVIVFVMWNLLAAFPCQERGSSAIAIAAVSYPAPPRQLPWAAHMVALQERIAEEWRRERKCPSLSSGLLKELQSMARCGRVLVYLGGRSPLYPLDEWQREEVAGVCSELEVTCRTMEEELRPLQRRVREVFHRLVLCRAEVLDCLIHGSGTPSAVP